MKKKQILGLLLAFVLFIGAGVASVAANAWVESRFGGALSSLSEASDSSGNAPDEPYLGLVRIEGEISSGGGSPFAGNAYEHDVVLDRISTYQEDNNNAGLLLYVDTPGGAVYEADEVYLALKQYKELTGRPIYAYFAHMACSGGYYISMAADHICANRNSETGSIGVIMQLNNLSGLYEKLGIEEIKIASGVNKGMGSQGTRLTEEQRAIMQVSVDEMYDRFVEIVMEGRGMNEAKVRMLADGRTYTAQQALEYGMIDSIDGYENYLSTLQEELGIDDIYEPEEASGFLTSLLGRYMSMHPKSEAEILMELAKAQKSGVWYYAG